MVGGKPQVCVGKGLSLDAQLKCGPGLVDDVRQPLDGIGVLQHQIDAIQTALPVMQPHVQEVDGRTRPVAVGVNGPDQGGNSGGQGMTPDRVSENLDQQFQVALLLRKVDALLNGQQALSQSRCGHGSIQHNRPELVSTQWLQIEHVANGRLPMTNARDDRIHDRMRVVQTRPEQRTRFFGFIFPKGGLPPRPPLFAPLPFQASGDFPVGGLGGQPPPLNCDLLSVSYFLIDQQALSSILCINSKWRSAILKIIGL